MAANVINRGTAVAPRPSDRLLPRLGWGKTLEEACLSDMRFYVNASDEILEEIAGIESSAIKAGIANGGLSLDDLEVIADKMLDRLSNS